MFSQPVDFDVVIGRFCGIGILDVMLIGYLEYLLLTL